MTDKLDQPMVYQIRVKGHLGPRWADWFGGMTITLEDNGETLLTGPVVDQAALHGLLRKVLRDLYCLAGLYALVRTARASRRAR